MHWICVLLLAFIPIVSSVGLYEQCGGEGYTGPTGCDLPLKCFRRSRWFSSCQTECPGLDWECALPEKDTEDIEDEPGASNWEQCGGDGWNGATWCIDYPCQPRSNWYSQCRPDCPKGWICSEIPDEEVAEEDLDELESYDSEEFIEEEEETDDFPDPSTIDLDALQQIEKDLLGDVESEEDPFAGAEEEEESTLRQLLRNTVRATACKANGKSGTCISTSSCKGKSVPGYCPGAAHIQCCIPKSTGGNTNKPKPSNGGACGGYAKAAVRSIKGNGNRAYSVVKIKREHLANPGSYSLAPSSSDNTMTRSTACAFDKMATAARKAGVYIKVASGFRTISRQQYFWKCYVTKRCNGGNLAARPGTSNHGRGIALDLNTNCGRQTRARPNCGGSRVYQWLYRNAHKYGFTRTVKSEPWHWEFRGVGVRRAGFS